MQQALTQTVGLTCRLGLATFFAAHAMVIFSPVSASWLGPLGSHVIHTGSVMLDNAVAGTLGLVALWLLLGICSRSWP